MNDLRRLSHTGDPETSNTAALKLDAEGRQSLKQAIITLLDEKPRTDDELVAAYRGRAEKSRWPLIQDMHSIARRRSELVHTHHVVVDTGERRMSNMKRPAVVWGLAVSAEFASMVVTSRRGA